MNRQAVPMTKSEIEWAQVLDRNGLEYQYEPGAKRKMKPDFSFNLGNGATVHSEVKECRPNNLDEEVLSGQRGGFWGAREGRAEVRPDGRIDRTGWGGHFLKAAKQLEAASLNGLQTLVVFRSYSLTADLDGTDILLFLFGDNCKKLSEGHFRIEREKWGSDESPLPMVAFPEFANVGAVAYLKDSEFELFVNPLSRVQIDSSAFANMAGCERILELDFATTFHAIWRKWEPGHVRMTSDP